jgi:hypothetical protein
MTQQVCVSSFMCLPQNIEVVAVVEGVWVGHATEPYDLGREGGCEGGEEGGNISS